MNRKLLFVLGALALGLTGCNATQVADANNACHIATIAEAVDPVIAANNPKIVAGVTELCAGVAVYSTAPVAPAAQ